MSAVALSVAGAARVTGAGTLGSGGAPTRASALSTPSPIALTRSTVTFAGSSTFVELRELCLLTEDNASLAIGMTGLLGDHYMHGRLQDASRWASEQMSLVESIANPTLTVALSVGACAIKHEAGEFADVLRWSDQAIELARDDPTMGNLVVGSPLALALALRGFARWALGRPGWRDDYDRATAMARATDPITYAWVVNTKYTPGITCGVIIPDDTVMIEIEEALRIAERSVDDVALGLARTALGIALVHRDSAEQRAEGLKVLAQLRDMCVDERYYTTVLHFGQVYIARESARHGDGDDALPLLRSAADHMYDIGQLGALVPATATLVELLLHRGAAADMTEAEAAIGRLASVPFDAGFVLRDMWLLRLRALVARVHDDETGYLDLRDRYRDMAASLGFEGHMEWAEAMP